MKKHEILSPQSRAFLFDAPPDPISIGGGIGELIAQN